MEEWRDIKGYEGLYQVSNLGRVRSLERKVKAKGGSLRTQKPRILAQHPNFKGYMRLNLSDGNKREHFLVHRLVYQAFNGELIDGLSIDHIDNDKTRNTPENLQQITHRENNTKDQFRHDTTSRFVGVHWDHKNNRWFTQIGFGKSVVFLGRYKSEGRAAIAYQLALHQKEKIQQYGSN